MELRKKNLRKNIFYWMIKNKTAEVLPESIKLLDLIRSASKQKYKHYWYVQCYKREREQKL